jgi:hypothetical protein
VAGIRANHPKNTLAADNTTVFAELFDRRADFHNKNLLFQNYNALRHVKGNHRNRHFGPETRTYASYTDRQRERCDHFMAIFKADLDHSPINQLNDD